MSSAHTPGPWRVEPWSGGAGYAPGFYVARTIAGGNIEWMKTRHGNAARRFKTSEAAIAAITKATNHEL